MSSPSIAILGASADPTKFGNKAVRAYIQKGYTVYPINPKGGELHGLTVYTSLADVPEETLDRVSVYLPPAVLLKVLGEIASAAPKELWLNPGADSEEVIAQARELGLEPIVACSILDLGVTPEEV